MVYRYLLSHRNLEVVELTRALKLFSTVQVYCEFEDIVATAASGRDVDVGAEIRSR